LGALGVLMAIGLFDVEGGAAIQPGSKRFCGAWPGS